LALITILLVFCLAVGWFDETLAQISFLFIPLPRYFYFSPTNGIAVFFPGGLSNQFSPANQLAVFLNFGFFSDIKSSDLVYFFQH
jgi:hypothetical protein